MKKIKLNLHLWNKNLFLGASFVVFAIIASAFWSFIYASDLISGTTSGSGEINVYSTSGSGSTNDPIVVNAPTALSLYGGITLNSTHKSIPLTWTDNSTNEDRFILERRLSSITLSTTTSTNSWSVISDNLASNSHSFVDQNITIGTLYDYRVKACMGTICSSTYAILEKVFIPVATTSSGSGTSNGDTGNNGTSTPTPVLSLTNDPLTVYSTAIVLRWNEDSVSSTTSSSKYIEIKRKTGGLNDLRIIAKIVTPGLYYYKDLNVTHGVVYDYFVRSCYSDTLCSTTLELKGLSIPASVLTTTQDLEPVIPSIPTDLTYNIITQGSNTITLRWKDNSTNEDRFVVERRSSVSSTYAIVGGLIHLNTTEFIDKIEPGIYYEYRIKSCLLSECSGYTNLSEKVFIPKIVEPAPESPVVTNTVVLEDKEPVTQSVTVESKSENLESIISQKTSGSDSDQNTDIGVINTINNIPNIIASESESNLKNEASVLIYKDTNKDGISDYDSKYVYNIDPIKPSFVSMYEGRKITASDKILLGFDPTKKELIKVKKEEPLVSKASTVSNYKVNKIGLNTSNKISIKGQALPNSFITVYIYSTPIMVTVKTDSRGEWEYILDKELENGDHTVYTATVNNTGNIIAKSSPYAFTKTAEAVTLKELPVVESVTTVDKPGFINGKNIFMIFIALFMSIGVTLILIGLFTKKSAS